MISSPPHPCVFFDRDGVVNLSPGNAGYVTRWADFHFSPGIFAALRTVHSSGFHAVLVTSQQGVAKNLMSAADLSDIHSRMQRRLKEETGAGFLAIYACTHAQGSCTCRKPSPEMLLRAAADHDLDLARSWLVGDHDRDIEMALRAGIPASQTIRIQGDHPISRPAAFTLPSTSGLPALLRRLLPC